MSMTATLRRSAATFALVLAGLAATACAPAKPPATPTADPGAAEPVPPEESPDDPWNGRYSGDWGTMALRNLPDGTVLAAYSHDSGVVVGKFDGNKMLGRWCEDPSRRGPQDAGPVEFKFFEEGGVKKIDGRWKYDSDGEAGAWRDDWDVAMDGEPVSPELTALLDRAQEICK